MLNLGDVKASKLDAIGIDVICDRITEGESQAKIARDIGINPSHLSRWLGQHSARAHEARHQSADASADRAESVLIDAEQNSIEITRARELASHYRWMASKRRPAEYGDRIQQDINATVALSIDQVEAEIARLTNPDTDRGR